MVAVFKARRGLLPPNLVVNRADVRLGYDNTLCLHLSGFWLNGDNARPYSKALPRCYSYREEKALLRYAKNLFKGDPTGILPGFTLDSPKETLIELLPAPSGTNSYALNIFQKDFNYHMDRHSGAIRSKVFGAPAFSEGDLEDLDLMRDEVLAFVSHLADTGDMRGIKQIMVKAQ